MLLLQEFSRWRGTYGGMIRSDLHGAESTTNERCDTTMGKYKPKVGDRNKEVRCTRDTSTDLEPEGFSLSSSTLNLESP